MSSPIADRASADVARSALRLTRGITATWWYTLTAVVFLEVVVAGAWTLAAFGARFDALTVIAIGVGGLVWVLTTLPLVWTYRHRTDAAPVARWQTLLIPVIGSVGYGVIGLWGTGLWIFALYPLLQVVVLLNWPGGLRVRIVIAVTVVLAALCVVGSPIINANDDDASWWFLAIYSTVLPAMTVLSLWWWDVLMLLDRARTSEAQLAATRERLRLATDVHDLQGHHLQVIALQLELAERLLSDDPDGALEHLRLGRASVDDARQGTRDLATRFRSVSLRDEIANAADLLAAAGAEVEVEVAGDAEAAPSDVLGPVIRETTTNVLRHGGGRRARLALVRDAHVWRYEVANDIADGAMPDGAGSGLQGLARRAQEAGGSLEAIQGGGVFTVVIAVPAAGGR